MCTVDTRAHIHTWIHLHAARGAVSLNEDAKEDTRETHYYRDSECSRDSHSARLINNVVAKGHRSRNRSATTFTPINNRASRRGAANFIAGPK